MDKNIFPAWNPQRITRRKFSSIYFKERLRALRNSSSGFIKRTDVRFLVFNKNQNSCVLCHTNKNLTIDHIMSVYGVAIGEHPIEKLNVFENFQTLCVSCNSGKTP